MNQTVNKAHLTLTAGNVFVPAHGTLPKSFA
jgi:hypothetical protein